MTTQTKIARVQRTLAWLEADMPQLSMRVRDLSAERQAQAKQFAACVIDSTKAELERLLSELPIYEGDMPPCEPAD
jgi:hypothetical protein